MKGSTFVRKNAAGVQDPGIRPGLYGQTLVSTGHADLDRLLGGGLPLGTLLLILEDPWSTHHRTLARYFLAEGSARQQGVYLATSAAQKESLTDFLPLCLAGKEAEKAATDGNEGRDQDYKLRIAWQYQRYSSSGTSGSSGGSGLSTRAAAKDWCHQYDLTKSAGEGKGLGGGASDAVQFSGAQALSNLASSVARFIKLLADSSSSNNISRTSSSTGGAGRGESGYQQPGGVEGETKQQQRQIKVGRLAVLSLGSPEWQINSTSTTTSSNNISSISRGVLQTLIQLKAAVRDTPCAALITVPAALHSKSDIVRMCHVADTVLELDSVHDESHIARLAPEPGSVAGVLCLKKVAGLGSMAVTPPEAPLYLIRYKRKRIALTAFEIDPDAEARGAEGGHGTVSGGGVSAKPTASVLCGGPAKGKTDVLDF